MQENPLATIEPRSDVVVHGAFDDLFARDDGEIVLRHDGRAPAVMRARIVALMDHLLTLKSEHGVEMPHKDVLCDGMYLRKLYIPKGTLLVGRIHLQHCLNIVAAGDISVLTEAGAGRLRAGDAGASPPGYQKVGLAHADTVFINVFRTHLTDIHAIEAQISAERIVQGELVCL